MLIKLKMTSKLPWRQQVKSVFQSSNTLKLGTFMGGFAALFRVKFDNRNLTVKRIGKKKQNHCLYFLFFSCALVRCDISWEKMIHCMRFQLLLWPVLHLLAIQTQRLPCTSFGKRFR